MRGFHRVYTSLVFAALLTGAGCRSKTQDTAGSGGSAKGSQTVASGSTTNTTVTGGSGSGSSSGSAAGSSSGSAAPDPRIAALSAEEKRTCGIYATCKVAGLRDDDPQAPAKQPQFEQDCLKVWVTLAADEKKKIADCADKVGECQGPPDCFDSMKISP